MEDIQTAIQSILSDPAQMEQISAMANALGLSPPGNSSEEALPDMDKVPSVDPKLLRLLNGIGQQHGPEEEVLSALRQVLSEPGQERIDRALRAARLSRAAGTLLKREG